MWHFVVKLLFCVVNLHQKGLECGFAETISEHFNTEAIQNLYNWKIADFYGIWYRDVSEIIQSYYLNCSENWIEIFR